MMSFPPNFFRTPKLVPWTIVHGFWPENETFNGTGTRGAEWCKLAFQCGVIGTETCIPFKCMCMVKVVKLKWISNAHNYSAFRGKCRPLPHGLRLGHMISRRGHTNTHKKSLQKRYFSVSSQFRGCKFQSVLVECLHYWYCFHRHKASLRCRQLWAEAVSCRTMEGC